MYETPKAEIPFPAERLGIPWVRLYMRRFLEAKALRDLNRLIGRGRFDIVHTHLTRPDWYGRTITRWQGSARLVSTIHGQDRFFNRLDFGPVGGRLVAAVNRFTMRWVEKLVAVSEGVKRYLLETEKVPSQQVAVVRNGIELDQFDPSTPDVARARQRLGVPEDAVLVGTVCIFHPRKGLVHLVRAARKVVDRAPQTCFALVGLGPQEPELRALVAHLNLETKVLFRGGPHPEVASLVRAMDLFVLPSLIDGLGLAALEAQALERPCIITSIPGLSETVLPGETGLIVPPGDESALADAILSLLNDPDKRGAMGRAGRRHIEEHYSASRMASEYQKIYEEVLEEH